MHNFHFSAQKNSLTLTTNFGGNKFRGSVKFVNGVLRDYLETVSFKHHR